MARIFTLTDDIRAIAAQAIDDLISNADVGGLGKTCKLVYPPKWVSCSNCIPSPIGGQSSNRWITGGPMPFNDGTICPLCGGSSKRAEEATENITMLLAMEPAHFFVKVPSGINVPTGTIQSKGMLADIAKVMRAKEMIVSPASPFKTRYVLDGEPIDVGNIIQSRYFVAFWKRVG